MFHEIYCAAVGCNNHSNKKNTTEKMRYFRLTADESLCRTSSCIWSPVKHLRWGLFWEDGQRVEADAYFRGRVLSWMFDRILNATQPNNLL